MKKNFLALVTLISMNAFSQSYFILENGLTLTVDINGYVYDLNQFTALNKITFKGGQFLTEEPNIIVTVDDMGTLYRKYEVFPKQIVGKGMNYFIGDNGSIYTIDYQGVVNLFEGDARTKKASKFGGNYFTTESGEIVTINNQGKFSTEKNNGLRVEEIFIHGGNYFMTKRGILYTVSEAGKISDKRQERVGIIVKKGGNYFVDSIGTLYTVAQDGSLKLPALPISLKIHAISKLGANYFMNEAGKLYTVDKDGNVFERWVNQDLKKVKVISL